MSLDIVHTRLAASLMQAAGSGGWVEPSQARRSPHGRDHGAFEFAEVP
jgi:hypothetical protein